MSTTRREFVRLSAVAAGVAMAGPSVGAARTVRGAAPDETVASTGLKPAVRGSRVQIKPLETIPVRQCLIPGELLRCVPTSQLVVVLTFDDGPHPTNSLAIANILRSRGYEGRATFFQIGDSIRSYPWVTRELSDRGYEIGNHSMRHTPYNASLASQIGPAQDLIYAVTSRECMFFRSPGLTQSGAIQATCARLGIINVFTDADERDSVLPRIPAWTMNANFSRFLHPGYIGLRHDGQAHQPTVEAVHGVLDIIERRGYQPVSLSDALRVREDLTPANRTQGYVPDADGFEGQAPADTADGPLA